MLNIKYLILVLVLFLLPSVGWGCPYFLYTKDLGIKQDKNIKEYNLLYYEKSNWVKVEYDIEALDSLNQIHFNSSNDESTKKNKDKNSNTELNYRIVIDSNLGGERISYIQQDKNINDNSVNSNKDNKINNKNIDKIFPCRNIDEIYEIKLESDKYLYFMSCELESSNIQTLNIQRTVNYEENKNLLSSPLYKYLHYSNNHVIFKEIDVHAEDNTLQLATDNATLNVYLDIKYFFSMELKSSSIISKVRSWYFYPTRTIADLIFYWKILFMDVDINMGSTASFYRDSVYIPFRLNVPVDASNYLNPSSGVIYSWNVKDIIEYDVSGRSIPIFNIKDIEEGSLVNTGLKYCGEKLCKFSLNGTGPEFGFSSYFVMDRSMVEKGFFPYLVLDESKTRRELGWDSFLNENLKNRIGIYLNISGMNKKDYYWDMWIDMKKDSKQQYSSSVCPKEVKIEKLETGK